MGVGFHFAVEGPFFGHVVDNADGSIRRAEYDNFSAGVKTGYSMECAISGGVRTLTRGLFLDSVAKNFEDTRFDAE